VLIIHVYLFIIPVRILKSQTVYAYSCMNHNLYLFHNPPSQEFGKDLNINNVYFFQISTLPFSNSW